MGRRTAIAVEVALAIPPGKVRVPKGSMAPSVLVLVWEPQVSWLYCGTPKCLGFSVGPPSILFLVWGHYYTGFSMGGRDMDR